MRHITSSLIINGNIYKEVCEYLYILLNRISMYKANTLGNAIKSKGLTIMRDFNSSFSATKESKQRT